MERKLDGQEVVWVELADPSDPMGEPVLQHGVVTSDDTGEFPVIELQDGSQRRISRDSLVTAPEAGSITESLSRNEIMEAARQQQQQQQDESSSIARRLGRHIWQRLYSSR